MRNERWITSSQLADLAGISRQAAHKAAKRGLSGCQWNHCELLVRLSGTRYEVALSSLSDELQARFRGNLPALPPFDPPAEPAPFVPRANGQDKREAERFALIEPAVRWDITPAERTATIKAIVMRSGKSENTVRRYIKAYDRGGYGALGRALPKDARQARVFISRRFDAAFLAADGAAAVLPSLSEYVDEMLRGLWKGRAGDAGWADLGKLAEFLLLERCEELGVPVALEDCWIGRRRVEQWKRYKVVNLMRNNAKAFHDSLPRIARDWTKLDPMETVVADVKHLDVMVTDEKGNSRYPKMIGFMDAGTGRIFPYLVLCPERRSITQELVIEAFCAMAEDPSWGFPNQLYLDNGSEFGGLDRIIPALRIVNADARREIIRAKPYNAAAKPIEPLFARLDRYCFSALPGYTGPDRTAKKTQNVGKAPEPFAGTWEQFTYIVGGLIAYYHGRHVGGQWNASPNDIFRAKVEAGWRPIMPQPLALEMAFCDRTERKLTKQGIRTDRGRFTHPALLGLAIGTSVEVIVPWRKDAAPIALLAEAGPVQLVSDYAYPANHVDGARDAGRRQQTYRKSVARMAKDGPTIDPIGVKLRIAGRNKAIPIPGRTRFLDQGAALHELRAVKQFTHEAPAAASDEAARRREREMRRTERLERDHGRGF